MHEKVSVVIANYNMGRFLGEAVDSVLAQTYPVYEVHVVDDGSTDDTLDVMQRYRGESRVQFHRQRNQGQAVAKNRGILSSKGDYVAFCDADDMWTRDKLEKQIPRFGKDRDIGVVHTNFVLMREDGTLLHTPQREYYSGWISDRLLIDNCVNGMASVVRRECFERVGVFDESLSMGIDYDLWLRISAHYRIEFLDEVTYLYRQWPGQMSRRHTERYECAVRIMRKFLENHPAAVSAGAVREAWAHTYVGRGRNLWAFDQAPWQALRYYLKALGQRPEYWPAWKEILRLILRRPIVTEPRKS